ncbi:MAG: DUF11 domain-containing protein, partial [Gemmatimonadetes bacterium]|nr:DUF11 domain-containing protein [Gemmatimonadota bacterium]
MSSTTASLVGLLGGDPPPEPVQVSVTNSGSGTLGGLVASVTYPTGAPTGWLSPGLSGTTAPTTLTLSAAASGLEIGEYGATVSLTSAVASNSPQTIDVTLRVVADRPVIQATPALVGFSGVSGGQRPPEQIVMLENVGGGELDDLQVVIEYEGFGDWLTAALSGSTAPAQLSLEVDPAPLAPGSYQARARLTSAKALNSPKDVVVSFNVEGRADIRVTKLGPDSLPAGTRVAYGLEVRNEGPSAAETVVFTDTLPENAALVDVPSGATLTGRVLRWDLGMLQNGDQRSFTVEMDVPSNGLGLLRNVAAAVSPTPDPAVASRVARTSTRVLRVNDLDVRKAGPDSAFAGRTATYDIVVVNRGPSDAVSVVVSDSLPNSVTFVPGTDGAAESGGVVTWPVVPSLVAGDSVVLQATVLLPSDRTGALINTAWVATATRDPDTANDTAIAATPVVVYADLAAVARAPAQDTAGTPMTVQAGVRNLGPADAAAVVVSDTLPAGLTFVSATGGGTEAGGVVTWPAIPVLTPGDSAIYDVVVDVGTGVGTALTHRVGVTSTTPDPGPTANTDTATTTVIQLADLNVAKTGPAADTAGTVASYAVVVRNDGPSEASTIVVVDSLPPGSASVVASDGGVVAAGVVTWPTVPTIAVGDSIIRTVQLVLDPAATGTAVNVARAGSTTTDPDTLDNRAAVTTSLSSSADLAIAKSGPASAVAGDTLVYTLTISNAGPSTATAVVVTDTLPAGTSFVRASTGGSASGRVVTWTGGTLAPAATAQVTVTARVLPARTADITNVATVASAVADPVAADNRATTTSTVQVAADLTVTKTGPASVTAGSGASWTVQVTNNGPSTARNVVLTDTLPAGVSFVSATGGATNVASVVT